MPPPLRKPPTHLPQVYGKRRDQDVIYSNCPNLVASINGIVASDCDFANMRIGTQLRCLVANGFDSALTCNASILCFYTLTTLVMPFLEREYDIHGDVIWARIYDPS